jgi:hypothetical protein
VWEREVPCVKTFSSFAVPADLPITLNPQKPARIFTSAPLFSSR